MRESDPQLVLRARFGDREAYGELVARHQGRVRGWLRQLCGEHAEADDLAQDAFVHAWNRIVDLKDTTRFAPWLMKIAYSEFLQKRRTSLRRERLMDRHATEQEILTSNDESERPYKALELQRVLAVLSERERAVVVLNYAYGYSHGEVSQLTGLPLGTVKSLIHRGSQKVREQFDARV